jgi:hypothetical protein
MKVIRFIGVRGDSEIFGRLRCPLALRRANEFWYYRILKELTKVDKE